MGKYYCATLSIIFVGFYQTVAQLQAVNSAAARVIAELYF
jgi:hypothetical protein